jgi:hypothetical protein
MSTVTNILMNQRNLLSKCYIVTCDSLNITSNSMSDSNTSKIYAFGILKYAMPTANAFDN